MVRQARVADIFDAHRRFLYGVELSLWSRVNHVDSVFLCRVAVGVHWWYMNKKVLIAGLVASIIMAMMEMAYEWFFGVGFWAAPTFISAVALRGLQAVAVPVSFALVPVVLGMMGHMMNSVILGFLFVSAFGKRLVSHTTGMIYGAVYALVVFFLMWFAVLPLINPVMLQLNPYVFALSHVVWGMVLGYMVVRSSAPQAVPTPTPTPTV